MRTLTATTSGQSLIARCSVGSRPHAGAVWLGLALSAASLLASNAVLALLRLALPASVLGPATTAGLGNYSAAALYVLAVLLGPLVEMLMFQCLPIELLRRLRLGAAACVGASALLFGAAHDWNGGLAHGASALASGLVFAYGYVLCRPYGWRSACLAAFTAHAAHNAVLVSVGLMFPGWM